MELTHFNTEGRAHMVDVSEKAITFRAARAAGQVQMNAATMAKIREGTVGKGDVLAVAQVAGIMENGKAGEPVAMDALLKSPATVGAARLTGCRSFFPAERCREGARIPALGLLLPDAPQRSFTTVGIPSDAIGMPTRNTMEQLTRLRRLCDENGLFQVSGEDINSPRQSFIIRAMVLNNVLIFVFSPQHGVELYKTSHVLFSLGGRYVVTKEQLFYHLNLVLKYLSTIPIVLLFVCTTNPSEFAASLNRIGVKYTVAYSVALALRYIPDIQREYHDISQAQQARGIEMSKKQSLGRRLKSASAILTPLILSSMREAGVDERTIRATACHGYGLVVDIRPEHEMEKVLFASDELTGLIWAAALMRPSKSTQDM